MCQLLAFSVEAAFTCDPNGLVEHSDAYYWQYYAMRNAIINPQQPELTNTQVGFLARFLHLTLTQKSHHPQAWVTVTTMTAVVVQ
jgi:hypothetical protein